MASSEKKDARALIDMLAILRDLEIYQSKPEHYLCKISFECNIY